MAGIYNYKKMQMSKVLENEIDRMKKEIWEIKDKIDSNSKDLNLKIDNLIKDLKDGYVSKVEFRPYERAMNVIGKAVLLAILWAFLSIVIIK